MSDVDRRLKTSAADLCTNALYANRNISQL